MWIFMKKRLILFIVLILILPSCSALDDKKSSAEFFAMDTYMTITAYGDNSAQAVEAAQKRVEELDNLLNAEDENSESSKLNTKGESKLSEDVFDLVSSAIEYSRLSRGSFNPTMHNISKMWGFIDKNYRVPEKSELNSALALSNPEDVILDKKTKTVKFGKKGMELDLGGIAKGYASSEVKRILTDYGVYSAVINLGGNVQTLGKKPDSSSWNVALQNPDGDGYLASLRLSDKAVVTSGGYERFFEKDGVAYHHILNPDDGYPASSGLKSVSIISDDGVFADAMSTALFVMGEKKAVKFWKKCEKSFDFVLLTDDDRLLVTSGISDIVQSEYSVTIISE